MYRARIKVIGMESKRKIEENGRNGKKDTEERKRYPLKD
jgi:hypothetical protein